MGGDARFPVTGMRWVCPLCDGRQEGSRILYGVHPASRGAMLRLAEKHLVECVGDPFSDGLPD